MSQRNRLIIGLVIAMIVLVTTTFIMPIIDQEYSQEDWTIILSYGMPYFLCLLVSLCFVRFSKMHIPTLMPRASRFSPFLVLSGVVLMFTTQIIVSPLVNVVPDAYIQYMIDNQLTLQQSGFYPQLTAIFIAPILQEWTFRGIFQDNISRSFGPMWGIFISSFIFALTFISPRETVYMFGSGVAIAAIYYVTQSLSTVIWIHILFNGINYLIYLLFDTTISWNFIFEDNVFAYVFTWTICALLIIITAWWVSNHYDKKLFMREIEKK